MEGGGRKDRRKEGRKEARKGGRKEGRREGRKDERKKGSLRFYDYRIWKNVQAVSTLG